MCGRYTPTRDTNWPEPSSRPCGKWGSRSSPNWTSTGGTSLHRSTCRWCEWTATASGCWPGRNGDSFPRGRRNCRNCGRSTPERKPFPPAECSAGPFNSRRCLIPADGFYEWQGAKPPKQPYFIHLKDDGIFAFAGLWDRWKPAKDAEAIDTCTIITTQPNELMGPIHNRMPVIVARRNYSRWLDCRIPGNEVADALTPYPADEMDAYAITPAVNNPKNRRPGIDPSRGRFPPISKRGPAVKSPFAFPFRQVHLDFHTGPAVPDVGRDFDARQFARAMKDAHVDSVTVFAKCHHGHLYYATKRPERHLGLKNGLNLLGEQVEALHRQGIRAPIYLSVQCDEYAANTHPEWVARKPDGGQVKGGGVFDPGWQILDMSTPYQEYLAEQTREVLKLFHPVDGIFFDMCWDQPSTTKSFLQQMRAKAPIPAASKTAKNIPTSWRSLT